MGSLLALCTGRLYYAPGAAAMDQSMRDRIRQRLDEYRAEAHERIGVAVNMTRSKHAVNGTLSSSMCYLAINKDNETGFGEYMDRSAAFIRHVAPGSWSEYADELRDGGQKIEEEIMARIYHEHK